MLHQLEDKTAESGNTFEFAETLIESRTHVVNAMSPAMDLLRVLRCVPSSSVRMINSWRLFRNPAVPAALDV